MKDEAGKSMSVACLSKNKSLKTIATLLSALKSSIISRDIEAGRKVHAQAVHANKISNIYVANTLIHMYIRCTSLTEAHSVFTSMQHKNVVTWNIIIQGYATNNHPDLALQLYSDMKLDKESAPSFRTYIAVLMACIGLAAREAGQVVNRKTLKLGSLEKGMALHAEVRKLDCSDCNIYLANTLIEMYSKCGSQRDARLVFDGMESHDVVSWTSIMTGYVDNGESPLALKLFNSMDLEPDRCAFAAALLACATLGGLEAGRRIHCRVRNSGLEKDFFLSNSLVDFYGKCGSMDEAVHVFNSMPRRDLVGWSSLIAGYARLGDTDRVVEFFDRIREEGLQPDGVTFLSVLSACSHVGLVDKAKEYFEAMVSQYGIEARLEHYHCMVDILGRSNRLEEAVTMVNSMPHQATTVTWNTILGACWKWRNVEVGKLAFESSLRVDRNQRLPYVLMANVYRSVGMPAEQTELLRDVTGEPMFEKVNVGENK